MVNVWKILRSPTAGNRPSGGALTAGAPYVNFAEKQFGVVDSTPTPQDLIGVPFFSASANYSAGQPVNYLGNLYIALSAVTAGAWNAASWLPVVATPIDALAYNGIQINGSMELSQAVGTTGQALSGTAAKFVVDGMIILSSGAQVVTGQQVITGPPGFIACMQIWVGTVNASPGSTDYCVMNHRIEGYRISRLAWGTAGALPITLGFWVMAWRAGTYSGAVQNGPTATRSYPFTFTINASNTWEYKTVIVPGDTAGTWVKDNSLGMMIIISMMVGSGGVAAAGAWAAGTYYGATGTINGVASTSDLMNVTGLVILPGIQALTAARSPLIVRPFPLELRICQRYYAKLYVVLDTNVACQYFTYPVTMRANPTIAGGGAGFTTVTIDVFGATLCQTTRGYQTITLDARI